MKISIIIVNWNTKDLLLECLKSIDMQDSAISREVIVVDNGSTDGSVNAVKVAYPKTIIIENSTNLGFARANNLGIQKSRGQYICLINSDVEVLKDCLLRLTEYMDSNPCVGIAGPKILYPDRTIQNSCRKFPSLWNNLCPALCLDKIFCRSPFFSGEQMLYFPHDIQMNVDCLVGCFLVVRRDALIQVGLLDERYFIYQEEVDWCKQFRENGWNVSFYPEASAVHHHAASSSKDPIRFALAHQKAIMQYWRKHHGAPSRWTLRFILMINRSSRIMVRSLLFPVQSSQRNRLRMKLKTDLACLTALLRRDPNE